MATREQPPTEGWPEWADLALLKTVEPRENDLVVEPGAAHVAGAPESADWPAWDNDPAPGAARTAQPATEARADPVPPADDAPPRFDPPPAGLPEPEPILPIPEAPAPPDPPPARAAQPEPDPAASADEPSTGSSPATVAGLPAVIPPTPNAAQAALQREYLAALHRVQELTFRRDHVQTRVEQWRQGTLAAFTLALVMAVIIFWPL